MVDQSREAMASLGVAIRPTAEVIALSGGQRQSVAVARAAMWARSVIFMDEPTAALGVVQTQSVLDLIRRVRDAGTSVVLISHNMPQVLSIAVRVVVLRLGRTVGDVAAAQTTVDGLIRLMTSGTARGSAA
jgi:simple sugar transport system ATP-binding protein